MGAEKQALLGGGEKEKGSFYLIIAIAISAIGAVGFGWSLGYTATIMVSNAVGTDASDLLCPVYIKNSSGAFDLYNGTESNQGKMNCDLQLDDNFIFLMGAIVNGGAMVGALLFGPFIDRYGKRLGMVLMNVFYAGGYALTFFVPIPTGGSHWMVDVTNSTTPQDYAMVEASNLTTIHIMLLAARFLIGVAVGLSCCTIASYQMEISPTSIRGAIGTMFQIGIVFGILFSYLLGALLGWKLLALIPLIFTGLGAIATFALVESPVWLLSKGRQETARNNLTKLRATGTSGNKIEEILDSLDDSDENSEESGGFGELCGDAVNRKILLIGVVLMLVQQFSGINAIMFYAGTILQSVAATPAMADNYAVGLQVLQVVVTLSSAFFMDRAGRKAILIFAASGMFLTSYILAYYFVFGNESTPKELALGAFYGYVFFFGSGMGAIPWSILGEIFTPSIKGVASSICTAVNWTSSFVITFSLGYLVKGFQSSFKSSHPDWADKHKHAGMGVVFAIYGAVALIGIAFVKLYIPETKGKSMAQIQAELRGEKSAYKSIN